MPVIEEIKSRVDPYKLYHMHYVCTKRNSEPIGHTHQQTLDRAVVMKPILSDTAVNEFSARFANPIIQCIILP